MIYSGATSSLDRKRAVYNVARQFNLTIIEDDAYFYLQLPSDPQLQKTSMVDTAPTLEAMPGLQLPPSFFSIDTDGRVIRLDSLSKFTAPMGPLVIAAHFVFQFLSMFMIS